MYEATIRLSEQRLASLGLAELVATARTAGLRQVTELVCRGPGSVFHVRVDEPLSGLDLDAVETVEWFERLSTGEVGSTYLCKVDARGRSGRANDARSPHDGDGTEEDDAGLLVSVLGSRAAIGRSIAVDDDATPGPLLERLAAVRAPDSATADSLTERQMEIVRTASSMGYYEVPRQASSEEIADAVGLDASTVSEHLQRAQRNIVEEVLGPDG